ncbi:MAG: GNAT family N-acetyltransferase, partial [Croceibacterium sp.]
AVLRLAFGQFGLATIFGQTSESNAASWGLMKRLGMTRRSELDYFDPDDPPEDNPTMIWSLEGTAWQDAGAQAGAHA